MPDDTPIDDSLIQNLADAGLGPEEIERFLCCCKQERKVAQMQILNEYRGKLLGTVQENQERLYCLDYLIRKLKEKERNS